MSNHWCSKEPREYLEGISIIGKLIDWA